MKRILRVLVIEDDALIASLLAETVEALGHTVCAIAMTENEAVAYALEHQPDLLIVDAGLIDGNGISAVETILRTQLVPYLFVTGNGREVKALHPTAVILEKPFFVPELVRAIERALFVSVHAGSTPPSSAQAG
jgi:two-component system, response regulator PdtaR